MTASSRDTLTLDAALAAFIRGPVAINLASRDAAYTPSIARGYGCRVSTDRRRITVFLALQCSQAILRDLRAGAPLATVFCLPSTHETLQFKSPGAELAALESGDRAIMRAYAAAFRAEISAAGYVDPFSSALVAPAEEDAVAVSFAPSAIFDQTPGPEAGKPLGRKP